MRCFGCITSGQLQQWGLRPSWFVLSLLSLYQHIERSWSYSLLGEEGCSVCVCVILLSGKKMRIVAMLEAKKRKASTFGGDERYDPDAWKCFLFALPEYSEELKNDLSEYRRF